MLDATTYRFHPPRLKANGWPRTTSALTTVQHPEHIARITRDRSHLALAIGMNRSNAIDAIARVRMCIAAIRGGYATAKVHDSIAEALSDLRRARRLHSDAMQVAARLAREAA
jgi:hypothetical protein